jgi:hypothetical protein
MKISLVLATIGISAKRFKVELFLDGGISLPNTARLFCVSKREHITKVQTDATRTTLLLSELIDVVVNLGG